MSQSNWTPGEVAQAIAIPLATLRTWADRDYISPAQAQPGQWRHYDELGVAYIAALTALARHMAISDAGRIMQRIADTQTSGVWAIAVRKAEQGNSAYVGVKRYAGRREIDVDAIATSVDLMNFFQDKRIGAIEGDEDASDWTDNVCAAVYDVGPAIRLALSALPR